MTQSVTQPQLILYKFDACPFCYKVMHYMDRHGLEVPMRDTRVDPEARADLIRLGGRGQVPALQIDDRILYESDAIIAWLQQNLVQAAPAGPPSIGM